MTKKRRTDRDTADLIKQEAELLQTGLALQEQGLQLLLAEMHALAAMMPGSEAAHPTEAETEESFDNMPV
ncbi:MAG: hypothetical protein C0524_16960 [Rhodobacter sp.]|nr:hypothetical protein [Rhodobacter sp.]